MNPETRASILLVDDGELDAVAALLESQGHAFHRVCGDADPIPAELLPPSHLLIVTPRNVERVHCSSPAVTAPRRPLCVIAIDEDSASLRRSLLHAGMRLLVRLPAAEPLWRLIITRALYRGDDRRQDLRVSVGSPVAVADPDTAPPRVMSNTTLIDLSNRGCRLYTTAKISVDDVLAIAIPTTDKGLEPNAEPLELRGRVRRIVQESHSEGRMIAMTFETDLPESTRTRLASLINHWASGPDSFVGPDRRNAPSIPPCQLPSIPDLTLDDETDPPVRSRSQVPLEVPIEVESGRDRRLDARAQFESRVLAQSPTGPMVLIGRDLSPGGMRVEAIGDLRISDRFRLALHGPELTAPLIVQAEVVRDDGEDGFALAFRDVGIETARGIEKILACLPDVEALEDGEAGGISAILSELMPR